jgi:pyrimidine-nucleoside phosphorylase
MRVYDIIRNKREKKELSKEEIEFFIKGYTSGEVPDYQASALLMAIFINGMTNEETIALTMAIAHSGDMVDLSLIDGVKADKHSTGGVGDKTTLIVAPIVASCGVKVAKMSGRGLGHTGGTIDKLESIDGYRTVISQEEFVNITNKVGVSIIGQSGNLAPADKKLYALRDVTATIESLPLIVSSIMGKKLAVGADCIVLDVKTGSGSFNKTKEQAIEMAKAMVEVGKGAGKQVAALITDMDIPLGFAIGNSLEVIEAVDVLSGNGPDDLKKISIELAASMLNLAGKGSYQECIAMANNAIKNRSAYNKFIEMVDAHGGNTDVIKNTALFKQAKYKKEILSKQSGYISHTNTEKLGVTSLLLGAGRFKKEDSIDYKAGIMLKKKTCDYVNVGDVLAIFYTDNEMLISVAEKEFYGALTYSENKVAKQNIIIGKISTKD